MSRTPTVSDLMNKDVTTIESDSSVLEAAEVMTKNGVGSLVVVANGKPVGIVTERDIMVKVVAGRKNAASTKLTTIMSTPLITVEPQRSVKEAAKIMLDNNIRRLVVFEDDALIGIITIRDITRSIVSTIASPPDERILERKLGDVIEFET